MSAEQRVLVHLNLGGNELRNVVLESLPAHPEAAVEGRVYWNNLWHAPVFFDGTAWQVIPTAAWAQAGFDQVDEQINALTGELYQTTQTLTFNHNYEVDRATAAETQLAADIATETEARIAGDAAVQANVNNVASDLAAEVSRATAAEAGLASDIADLSSAVSALDGNYATDTALATAVSNLEAAIASEASDRVAADSTLTSDLTAEIVARQAADATLTSDLAAETSARTAADAALQSAIDAEAATRAATDTEIGTHIQNLYGSQNGVIFPALMQIDQALQGHEGRLNTIEADYATKQYVDAAIQGLDIVESVKALVDYTTTDANGNTVPGITSGLEVSGVTLNAGDRVLIIVDDPQWSGIWLAAEGAWTKAADVCDPGTFTFVEAGSYAGTGWVRMSDSALWTQFSGAGTYSAGLGLEQIGNTFYLQPGAGLVVDEENRLSADRSLVPFKFAANIGDGTTNVFTVEHNLGTPDVTVSVRDAANGEMVLCSIAVAGNDTVTVTFASAPSTDAYRVVVVG